MCAVAFGGEHSGPTEIGEINLSRTECAPAGRQRSVRGACPRARPRGPPGSWGDRRARSTESATHHAWRSPSGCVDKLPEITVLGDENSPLVHGHLDDGAILCTCRNLGHGHYVMPGCPQCSYHTKVAAFVSQEAHSCLRLDQHRLFSSPRTCGTDEGGLVCAPSHMRDGLNH